ncbi:MAG: nucleotide exchange factor GrpE [Kiritimatiellae bacterium]|nr:nucleotide exchange factor GrpE [Kiritimatiellia bacterium]
MRRRTKRIIRVQKGDDAQPAEPHADENEHVAGPPPEPGAQAAAGPQADPPAPPAQKEAQPPQGETGQEPEDIEALKNRLLRLQADFDNFRKRTLREKDELYQRANEDIMLELLPVLDHLELGLQAAREHHAAPAFVEGLQMVGDQLLGALKKFGLTPIETDCRPFDPEEHEAVSYLPSPERAEGQILVETRKGYRLGQRLLRAAQVVVSSGPAAGEPGQPAAQGAEERG